MDTFLNVTFKQVLDLYQLGSLATEIDNQIMNQALFDINHPNYLQTFFDSWMITFVVLLEFIKGIEWPMNSDYITVYCSILHHDEKVSLFIERANKIVKKSGERTNFNFYHFSPI